ncbi:hypothetical protein MAP00_002527 [Monascus purpureus]|nr:hypothetical protein MAP00_002527 [Monascus purpureus]
MTSMSTMPSVADIQRPRTPGGHSYCHRSIFLVNNIHCASCVAYIEEVLSRIPDVGDVDVSILTHQVCVYHGEGATSAALAKALIQAAFEVHHVTAYNNEGSVISDIDTTPWLHRNSSSYSSPRVLHIPTTPDKRDGLGTGRTLHIANCDACRKEELEKLSSSCPSEYVASQEKSHQGTFWHPSGGLSHSPSLKRRASDTEQLVSHFLSTDISETDILPPDSPNELSRPASARPQQTQTEKFNAVLSIGGMSCASCANSITSQVEQLEFVQDITVNLLTNSAAVSYDGPQSNIDKVVEQIEEIGFEASVGEVTPASTSKQVTKSYITEISIDGMTCGSCVGAVTRGVEELPFVVRVSVNLLSHSGQVEFHGRENLDSIVQKIEDLGYDASVTSVHAVAANDDSDESTARNTRTVFIRVNGMFCHHCPDKVLGSLRDLPDPSLVIEKPLSVKDPVLKITYVPHPPAVTIRRILSTIEDANNAFKATVYHPPSIEDRSRAMQLHERRRLLSRLLFVFVVTIPTFLIGIVFMSLVPSYNRIRMYLEHPIWAGNVTRIEWALFIMATPVMFYGTDVFHVRAAKEIYALWRPGSRVPILRRFYRFGSMNLLISAGTMVAYIASLAVLVIDAVEATPTSTHSSTYFDTVVFLTLFILAGRFMEAYSKAKTGDAVTSLGKLRPSEALLIGSSHPSYQNISVDFRADGIQKIPLDLLEVGDVVRVLHGTSPPADGIVMGDGSYQFDESSLTGESRPVKKTTGDQVYAGSVNIAQPVHVRITEISGSSMLDKIIAVVREGQTKRAPLERVADTITAHFVPTITLIAIVTFVLWLSLGESGVLPADYLDIARGGWAFWSLEFAISVFVVACPCGLALAAPTALFVGAGLAAKSGILVKGGGEAFQEASRLNAIVFDKTGTLTEGGSLKVSDHEVMSTDPEESQIAWLLARKLEENSNHPIAKAVLEFCCSVETSYMSVASAEMHEIAGQGMKGVFTVSSDGQKQTVRYEAAIGNERLLKGLASPDLDTYYLSTLLSKYQSSGKSTAILSLRRIDDQSHNFLPSIVFATSDLIRPESAHVVSQLQERHVEVFMCTGDNQNTAYAVADMLKIPRSNVKANALPADKADFIHQIQDGGTSSSSVDQSLAEHSQGQGEKQRNGPLRPIVAFVGDGVNDAPALAAADVSIAMASGSDVAINSASFILLNSNLSTILQLVILSRRVFNRVRMNFGWAIVYNLCLVPIAAGVFYPIVSGQQHGNNFNDSMMVNKHWRLGPVWAALAMALSSVSVISSSLALRIEMRGLLGKIFKWKQK